MDATIYSPALLAAMLLASSAGQSSRAQEAADAPPPGDTPVDRRISYERQYADNPFFILPHRTSYILPLSYNDAPNDLAFGDQDVQLDEVEAKFQISFKLPVWERPLGEHSSLFFGYTQLALWQLYNDDLSAPFRETNHEPELFLSFDTDVVFAGFRNRIVRLGLVHQSNGRAEPLSRSWNRVYAQFIAVRGNLALSFKPWYRLPEAASEDDNPDIEDFMGHAEFGAAYKHEEQVLAALVRNNFDAEDNRGAVQLSWSFPLSKRLLGYAEYFGGYGETLIDYDNRVDRIGIGVAMTSLF